MSLKILILCTGNSCRSQMAQGFLQSFDHLLTVRSAGTNPAAAVHPLAVKTMLEVGIDISQNVPALVDDFLDSEWDYVITVGFIWVLKIRHKPVAHRTRLRLFSGKLETRSKRSFLIFIKKKLREALLKLFDKVYESKRRHIIL